MLKHGNELLQRIAAGLNRLGRIQIACVEVTFKTDSQAFTFALPEALDVIASGLYWDERGDWSDARIAIVESS